MAPKIREASHAGSWYTDHGGSLGRELDRWLAQVPASVRGIGSVSSRVGDIAIPAANARAIIAPHAGYSYSGAAAAWAYKSADWANAERVFLIGPSHHKYFTSALVTACDEYRTPLGNLTIDREMTSSIKQTWGVSAMDQQTDEDEHSLEMHLPYIFKMLSLHNKHFQADSSSVRLVPILIGATNADTEKKIGRYVHRDAECVDHPHGVAVFELLSEHLQTPGNLFIISSDFCHWGSRFRYTHYRDRNGVSKNLRSNTSRSETRDHPIHESIKTVDFESMDAVETGDHDTFLEQLERTENTVCGRHPIGVFMAAVQQAGLASPKGKFKFVKYDRSGEVEGVSESSVSYCSAFAVL